MTARGNELPADAEQVGASLPEALVIDAIDIPPPRFAQPFPRLKPPLSHIRRPIEVFFRRQFQSRCAKFDRRGSHLR